MAMMDCPRCGFTQPKDRYCANCGVDVEAFARKPKPVLIRILQSPNFYLSLIVILILWVVGFIFYSRSGVVSRHVGNLLNGKPLSSRERALPDSNTSSTHESRLVGEQDGSAAATLAPPAPAPATDQTAAPGTTAADHAPAAPDPQKLDLAFWEIPRDNLAGLIPSAEKIGEGSEGRVYLFKDSAKVTEALKSARRLALNRTTSLQPGAQIMVVTPPQAPEAFQFGLALQLLKWEEKSASLHWDSQLVLSQSESPQEMVSPNPSVKAVTESTISGSANLTPSGAILMVIEPSNRRPRDEFLAKAGEGPWAVFASDDFRNGVSDWIVVFQLK